MTRSEPGIGAQAEAKQTSLNQKNVLNGKLFLNDGKFSSEIPDLNEEHLIAKNVPERKLLLNEKKVFPRARRPATGWPAGERFRFPFLANPL